MPGSTVNNGIQQVSIFPFQELRSYLGNEILYNLFDEGVYNASISVSQATDPNSVVFGINPGTTLIFRRTVTDVNGNANLFIGKVVLTQIASITQPKSYLWQTASGLFDYKDSHKLYIVADWTYDLADPTKIYANFTLESDFTIGSLLALNGTTSHILIVGTVLNQQSCVSQVPGGLNTVVFVPNSSGGIGYHLAYDSQLNRNMMKRATSINQGFYIDFDPDGRGVYVNIGNVMVSGSIINQAKTSIIRPAVQSPILTTSSFTVTSVVGATAGTLIWGGGAFGTITLTSTDISSTGAVAAKIASSFVSGNWSLSVSSSTVTLTATIPTAQTAPTISLGTATNITFGSITTTSSPYFISSITNGTRTTITSSLSNYVQIDVLRVKNDELTHATSTVWESYISLLSLSSPFTAGFPSFPINSADLKTLLNSTELPVHGEGKTLLIGIRNLSSIPTADGSNNLLWPENCLILNEETAPIPPIGASKFHRRLKLPVWTSYDIYGNRG